MLLLSPLPNSFIQLSIINTRLKCTSTEILKQRQRWAKYTCTGTCIMVSHLHNINSRRYSTGVLYLPLTLVRVAHSSRSISWAMVGGGGGGGEKHGIYAAAFGSYLFYDLFLQGLGGGPWPFGPPLDPLLA